MKHSLHVNTPMEADVALCDCNVDDSVARATAGGTRSCSSLSTTTSVGASAEIKETNNTVSIINHYVHMLT